MADIALPDLSLLWASAGDILQPSDSKIQQGWAPEIPPRQWFNWLDNRQDEAIAHIAQHGIAVWSDALEYQSGKSYVQGSDGIVYKALTTNTNINPVGGAPGNWQSAFLTADQAVQVATAAQSRAMTANNVYLSPLQLANAFTGSNQSLTANGYQKLPGGLILQWGSITTTTSPLGTPVVFPIPFPTACVSFGSTCTSATVYSDVMEIVGGLNTTTVNVACVSSGSGGVSVVVSATARWWAFGY